MNLSLWCEHEEKISKISTVNYSFVDREVKLIVQTWMCPLCGIHGATTEVAEGAGK